LVSRMVMLLYHERLLTEDRAVCEVEVSILIKVARWNSP
jgi:hypothetical protein